MNKTGYQHLATGERSPKSEAVKTMEYFKAHMERILGIKPKPTK